MGDVFIGRKPILDINQELFAHQLKLYTAAQTCLKEVEAGQERLKSIQNKIGYDAIFGNRMFAFISLPREILLDYEMPDLVPLSRVVIEVNDSVLQDVPLLKVLKKIKISGGSIALDAYQNKPEADKLLGIVDWVKVKGDISRPEETKAIVDHLHAEGLKVIASEVGTEAEFNECRSMGFDYCQGYFFTQPIYINGFQLNSSQQALLRLMGKINHPETDFDTLAEIVGQDVRLSQQLLIVINQPRMNVPVRIDNIRQALQYFGLVRLKFWISTMLMGLETNVTSELLVTSLARARFCEQFAILRGELDKKDSFFLVGLLSNLNAFFRIPIEQVVSQMALSEPLSLALTKQAGSMGDALKCVKQVESGGELDFTNMIQLDTDQGVINEAFLEAMVWARSILAT